VKNAADHIPAEAVPPRREAAPPGVYRGDVLLHWVLLVLSAAILVLSFVLRVGEGDRVVIPLLEITLPGVCSYKQLLGIDCPGCGLTRSFISLAHLDLVRAWFYNPAGVYLFFVVLFQVPYRWYQLHRLRRDQPEHNMGWLAPASLGLLLVLLILQWIARII
jgi:hypothetical protein